MNILGIYSNNGKENGNYYLAFRTWGLDESQPGRQLKAGLGLLHEVRGLGFRDLRFLGFWVEGALRKQQRRDIPGLDMNHNLNS